MAAPVITFLSDYGLSDEFVGVCHAVIATVCPEARVIDLTHGIPRHDVLAGAQVLAVSLPYAPAGVHLAVVDPDVGGQRRAVALELAETGRVLVGPDNGLLAPAAAAFGGVVAAVEVSHSPLRLQPVSATFHGRDIFAPIAAHLAAGAALAEVGRPIDPAELVTPVLPTASLGTDGRLRAPVTLIDRFGNLQTVATHEHLEALGLRLGREVVLRLPTGEELSARYVRTFAEAPAGELIVYEDAARRLAVAVSHGSAAERLGLAPGDELRIGGSAP